MINVSLLAAGVTLMVFAVIYPILRWFYSSVFGTVPGEMVIIHLPGRPDLLPGAVQQLYFGARPDRTARTLTPGDTRPRLFGVLHNIERDFTVACLLCWGNCRLDRSGSSVFVIGVAVLITAGIGLRRSRGRRVEERQNVRGKTGPFQTEEAEAALTAASPAPRPMLAKEQQQQARTIDKKSLSE